MSFSSNSLLKDEEKQANNRSNGMHSVFFSGFPNYWRGGPGAFDVAFFEGNTALNSISKFRETRRFRLFRCFLFFATVGKTVRPPGSRLDRRRQAAPE
jgi:hypothetical protein